jgi:membrane fusion protein, copper/silver efflux system
MRLSLGSLLIGITIGVGVAAAVFQWAPLFGREQGTQRPHATSALPPSAPVSSDHASHTASTAASTEGDVLVKAQVTLSENQMVVSSERLQSIGVKFAPAERRLLERTIRTVGRVEIDERQLARVNIKIEGWIDQLFVNYTGARVTKGQLLFTVYSPELVATQREYLLALKSRRMLGGSEFSEVAEGAKSLLDVARQRLELWDIPEHQIRDLERTGTVLKALHIHSPMTGTVMNKVALAGLHVNPGDELYTIANLSRIWILADIYEYELPLIKIGQQARVTLSYDPDTALTGRAGFIYPTIDSQTRTAKVRFEVENRAEQLKPGMYANVELHVPLGTRLVVPREAILESGERQVLFIHHGGGKLEWRTVRLGLQAEDWLEVIEGVKEGEHVVTSANFLIDSESRLKAAVGGMQGMQH